MRPKKTSPRIARQTTRRLSERLAGLQVPPAPKTGWVRSIRTALGMTQAQLAKRMGIARQNAAALEAGEVAGNITLTRLSRAAEALGCELRYVLVPREPLDEMIANQAKRRAASKLGAINRSQALEASAVASVSMSRSIEDLAREMEMARSSDLWDD